MIPSRSEVGILPHRGAENNPTLGQDSTPGRGELLPHGGAESCTLLKKIKKTESRKTRLRRRDEERGEEREDILILIVGSGGEIQDQLVDGSEFSYSLNDLESFHLNNRRVAPGQDPHPPIRTGLFRTSIPGRLVASVVKPRNPLRERTLPCMMEAPDMSITRGSKSGSTRSEEKGLNSPPPPRKAKGLEGGHRFGSNANAEASSSPKDASDRHAACMDLMGIPEKSEVKSDIPAPKFPKKTYPTSRQSKPAQPRSDFMVKVDEAKKDPAVVRFVSAWCAKYAETFPTLMAPKPDDIQPMDWFHSRTIVNRVGTDDKISDFLDFLFFYWPRYQEHFAKKVPPVPTITHTSYNLEDLVGRFGMVGTHLTTVDRIEAMRARGDSMSLETEEQYSKSINALKTFRYLE